MGAAPAEKHPYGPSPFVGRESELSTLRGALESARAGRGRVALIGGEPGIGKTRLVEELTSPLPRARVLWGRCNQSDGAPPYWPWTQALRDHVGRSSAEALRAMVKSAGGELRRLIPSLPEDVARPLAAEPALPPEHARFHLFDAVAELLRHVAKDEVLVLVLDDLQWADSDSLLLLRFVAAEAPTMRLLILATHRDAEMRQASAVPRIMGELTRLAHRITLRGLSEDEVVTFAHAAELDLARGATAFLHQTTGGNPFFVREIVALLRQEGWSENGHFTVPHGVREAVGRRLDRLPTEARQLLAMAAVFGRDFDFAPLARAVGEAPPMVLERLEEARVEGLVEMVPGATGRYRFVHAIVRDAVYDDLQLSERAELHRHAGEALEALSIDDLEPVLGELAHHFFRAAGTDSRDKAIAYASRAGERARRLLAFDEACGHYERALEGLRATGAPAADRVPVLLDFGEAQASAGDIEGYRATFLEAAGIARDIGDVVSLSRAALGFGSLASLAGGMDTTLVGLLEEAIGGLPPEDDPLRVKVLARLSTATYYGYPLERRDALSREAVEMARRLAHPAALARALESRYYALVAASPPEARLAVVREAVACAGLAGDYGIVCGLRLMAVYDHWERGEVEAADRELAIAKRSAEEFGLPYHRWRAALIQAIRVLHEGRYIEAEMLAGEAASRTQGVFAQDLAGFHAGIVFHVRRAHARLGELEPVLNALATDPRGLVIWRVIRALVHAELGRKEEAARMLEELAVQDFASLPVDWSRVPCLAFLAEACATVGNAEAARSLYRLLSAYGSPIVTSPAAVLGATARYLGILALTFGDHAEAIAQLDEAVALNRKVGARPEMARAQMALARALEAQGGAEDVERARSVRSEALETARALGMTELLIRSDATLEETAPARPSEEPRTETRRVEVRRERALWSLVSGEESMRLRDTKGLRYLLHLLREPGRELHVHDIAGEPPRGSAQGGGALDPDSARERLAELRAELEEAEEFNDLGRADALRGEIEDLAQALLGRVGAREPASGPDPETEKVRLNVSRAIHAVVKRIRDECPIVGAHLESSIKTGTICSYTPPPGAGYDWRIELPGK